MNHRNDDIHYCNEGHQIVFELRHGGNYSAYGGATLYITLSSDVFVNKFSKFLVWINEYLWR